MVITNPILQLKKVSISYTPGKNAVEEVSADIAEKKITAIMGPSGCGKSTLLRAINRMHDCTRTSRPRRDSPERKKYIKDKPHGSTTHGGNGIPTPEPVPHDEHL